MSQNYSLVGVRAEETEEEDETETEIEIELKMCADTPNECNGKEGPRGIENGHAGFQVIAPCDLEAGFEFVVQVNQKTAFVRVPNGGVEKGQLFSPIIIRAIDHAATYPFAYPVAGGWSDSICGCFNDSSFLFALLLPTYFVPQFLARVVSRIESSPQGISMKWLCWTILHFIVVGVLFKSPRFFATHDGMLKMYGLMSSCLLLIYLGLELFLVYRTYIARHRVRQKFAIPGDSVTDCCLSCWCRCCTVLQMYRHTKLMRGGEKPGKMKEELIHYPCLQPNRVTLEDEISHVV